MARRLLRRLGATRDPLVDNPELTRDEARIAAAAIRMLPLDPAVLSAQLRAKGRTAIEKLERVIDEKNEQDGPGDGALAARVAADAKARAGEAGEQ